MSDQNLFTKNDIDRFQNETGDAIRNAAILAQMRANIVGERPPMGVGGGGPSIPDFPDLWQGARIWARFAEEALRNESAFSQFSGTLASLTGGALIGQVRTMIQQGQGHADPQTVLALQQSLGRTTPPNHNTIQFGVSSGMKAGAGYGVVTGVAIPTKEGSKVKWFSGAELAGGVVLELEAVALSVGAKLAFPHQLKAQYYGAHVAVHLGAGMGFNVFFSADKDLHYEGFSFTIGVGAGGGAAILAGFELVTSD